MTNQLLGWSTLAILLTTATALDSNCQADGATPYNGYSLKANTGCTTYVYCVNGNIANDNLKCPLGLLFNGAVGAPGICTWAAGVNCGLAGGDEVVTPNPTPNPTRRPVAQMVVTPQPTPNPTPNPTPKPVRSFNLNQGFNFNQGSGASNSENWFCGSTFADAEAQCKPCPGKTMFECGANLMTGCFKGVAACASLGDGYSFNNANIAQASEQMTQPVLSLNQPQFDSPTPAIASRPVPQSQPSRPATYSQNQDAGTTPNPTDSPSLPPWTNAPFNPSPTSASKTVIGYYASWQWYDRNKFADPQNINFSKYDRINYAFFQPDTQGNLYGTDYWADPQVLMGPYITDPSQQFMTGPNKNHHCSWDGPLATDKNCAFHDVSKGLIHLAHAAGAQVWPSIGGWTLSDNFPTIAASISGRNNFARECVAMILEYGFDGIDIDWEYPGYEDHSGTPADTDNFTKLLKAVSDALGVLGQSTGKTYGLTAALPCGPDKIAKIDIPAINAYLTEFNLMSYDMHGAWDTLTGTNAPMFDQGWGDTSKRWSTHGCVNTYLEQNIPMNKINIGLSFYGRSFQKATGMKQTHGGADDINYHLDEGSPQYFNIVNELSRMTTYRHEKTQTQYAVFDSGDRGLVSYDDPRAICDKVDYANQRGLHGFLIWEISGDMIDMGNGQMATPLIDATNAKIQNPNFDCSNLRDPGQTSTNIAPQEPDTVDWSGYTAPLSLGSANDYNGAQVTAPRPAPTPGVNNYNTPANSVYVAPLSNSNSFAGLSTVGRGNDSCPVGHTGYYPTAGCQSYVYCNGGSVVGAVQPCSSGTLFKLEINGCTWAGQVQCGRN